MHRMSSTGTSWSIASIRRGCSRGRRSGWRHCRQREAPDSRQAPNGERRETSSMATTIRSTTEADAATILGLIRELAEYERLAHEVTATESDLRVSLFGVRPDTEAVIAECDGQVAGYALFFHNYSTFQCKRGLYLEDLFV